MVPPSVTSDPFTVSGVTMPGFEKVRSAFAAAAQVDDLGGSALAIIRGDDVLVDLTAGMADPESKRPWLEDTPSVLFSVSKAIIAAVVLKVAEAGELDMDAPVARYWPEFAQNGKSEITTRQVLAHRAGLIALDEDLTVADIRSVRPIILAIEKQAPLWMPDTAFAYHALTYGWILAELLERITLKSLGALVHELISAPLGIDIQLGASEATIARRASIQPTRTDSTLPDLISPAVTRAIAASQRPASVRSMSLGAAFPTDDPAAALRGMDDPALLAVGVPGAGVVASARDVATFFAACVREDGHGLLSPHSLREAVTAKSAGDWWGGACLPTTRFSTGFMLNNESDRRMLSETSFGHDGAIGQLGFADIDSQVGFAWTTNRQVGQVPGTRSSLIVDALRECLR
jgi:CubicO group peptidase (beta-lactamase class C family)